MSEPPRAWASTFSLTLRVLVVKCVSCPKAESRKEKPKIITTVLLILSYSVNVMLFSEHPRFEPTVTAAFMIPSSRECVLWCCFEMAYLRYAHIYLTIRLHLLMTNSFSLPSYISCRPKHSFNSFASTSSRNMSLSFLVNGFTPMLVMAKYHVWWFIVGHWPV